jgi:hypothetical protein
MGPTTPFIQGEVLHECNTIFGQALSGQLVASATASAKNHGLATSALESVRQANGDQIAMARPVGLLAVQDGVDLFVTQDKVRLCRVDHKEVDAQSEDAGGASQSKDPEQPSVDPSHMDEKEFDDNEEDGGDGKKKASGKNLRKDLVEAVPESSETEEEDEEFENAGTVDDDHAEDEDHVDPPQKQKKSSNPGCLFTNGCGFWSDDRSQLKTVVESAASKKKVGNDWQCDPSVFGLILRWAHKPSFNFAADVMNSNFVVAREIKLESAFDLCRLRGWILTRLRNPKEVSFCLEHKRVHACLKEAGFPPNHHVLQLKGVIEEAHCQKLETTVLLSNPNPQPASVTQTEATTTTTEESDMMASPEASDSAAVLPSIFATQREARLIADQPSVLKCSVNRSAVWELQ